ncbi:MAG TPA: bifunctional diaminohydroxyphosphoribosylaminopyrimidine deaminase/5-amino-6-(5-phosphoribosylamino)uracil reductase RibD [Bacteroidota bacterium]|nr:bifunctional diaminohydroxyphosphoribosylaminopyrimidine deaminase/5-amino-6-(5-phosphoribosylamino)uracil reductase RibD [Bacteroidota bacterium]
MKQGQQSDHDHAMMRTCLELASRGAGLTSPNPMVGAIMVKRGRIIGQGWHRRYGAPHAEQECLRSCREDPRGGTMYVSLEPCSHQGQTPPCAPALIKAGVSRVVIATKDPNPLVHGRGIRMLTSAGIAVTVGVLEEEARFFNRQFFTHITEGRPYVHVKIALSLDGKIAGGAKRWISSPASRRLVHRWRTTHDAVLVGAATVHLDRPSITVRHVRGRDPHVVVLDGSLTLTSRELQFPRANRRRVIVCTTAHAIERHRSLVRSLARQGVELFAIPARGSRIALDELVQVLFEGGMRSILVEGGGDLFRQFAGSSLVDEWSLFVAPSVVGSGMPAFGGAVAPVFRPKEQHLGVLTAMQVGPDVLLRAFREKYDPRVIGVWKG